MRTEPPARWSFPVRGVKLATDLEQLDLESEHGVGADRAAGPGTFSVSEVAGDEKLPGRADRHELKGLCPTRNDPVDLESRRLTALQRAVEDRPVDQLAFIMYRDGVGRRGLGSGSLFQNLVLQTPGQPGDARLVLVFGQESLALDFVAGRELAGHAGLLRLELLAERLEAGLDLCVFKRRSASAK